MKKRNKIEVLLALVVFLITVPIARSIRESFVGAERAFAYLALFGVGYVLIRLIHRMIVRRFGDD